MPDFLNNMAQIATQGVYGLGSMLLNNEIGRQREDYAREQNYLYNEKAARQADLRTRNLYNDFYSPSAQLQQIKNAGLSPSLLGQQGLGVSGQTGAMGQGAAGVAPTTFGLDPMSISQIKLNESQAKKNEAEADVLNGDNEQGRANIANTWASAGAKIAAANLTKAQTIAQELENYITKNTAEFSIWKAGSLAAKEASLATKAFFEAQIEELQWEWNKDTYNDRVDLVAKQKANLISDTWLKQESAKLNASQIEEIKTNIEYIISKNLREWSEMDINQQNADTYLKWVDGKLPYMEQELELEAKRLGVEKTKMILNFGGEVLKSVGAVIGIGLMKGKGSAVGGLGNPVYGMPPKTTRGGNATNRTERKLGYEKSKELYSY